jgi:hypothetical protein
MKQRAGVLVVRLKSEIMFKRIWFATIIVLLFVLTPVYANTNVSLSPSLPIANQPITFYGTTTSFGPMLVLVFSGSYCVANNVIPITPVLIASPRNGGAYNVTLLQGLPAGSYSVNISSVNANGPCVNFIVVQPQPVPEFSDIAATVFAVLVASLYILEKSKKRTCTKE